MNAITPRVSPTNTPPDTSRSIHGDDDSLSQNDEEYLQTGMSLEETGESSCLQEAKTLYLLAANQGNAQAKCRLANMLLNGKGGEYDPKEAYRLYHEAAEADDPDAMCALGKIYEKGILGVVQKNTQSAYTWYRDAYDRQHPEGVFRYAKFCIDYRHTLRWQSAQAMREFVEIIQQAGEEGRAEAYYYLGTLHKTGLTCNVAKGNSPNLSSNDHSSSQEASVKQEEVIVEQSDLRATEYWVIAAGKRHPQAIWEVGQASSNREQQLELFEMAAQAGNFDAITYFVRNDSKYEPSIEWQQVEIASKGGDPSATYLLSHLCTREGKHVDAMRYSQLSLNQIEPANKRNNAPNDLSNTSSGTLPATNASVSVSQSKGGSDGVSVSWTGTTFATTTSTVGSSLSSSSRNSGASSGVTPVSAPATPQTYVAGSEIVPTSPDTQVFTTTSGKK